MHAWFKPFEVLSQRRDFSRISRVFQGPGKSCHRLRASYLAQGIEKGGAGRRVPQASFAFFAKIQIHVLLQKFVYGRNRGSTLLHELLKILLPAIDLLWSQSDAVGEARDQIRDQLAG